MVKKTTKSKSTVKEKKSVGAPEKPIDWRQFEKLCALQCIQSEISSFFAISKETLRLRVRKEYNDNYLDIYKRFSEQGYISLRKYQFNLAKKNASMAIWLGKVLLGQKEDTNAKEVIETFVQLMKTGTVEEIKSQIAQSE